MTTKRKSVARRGYYAIAPRADHDLLDDMTDADLKRWACQNPLQRRYALSRRRWAKFIEFPIKMYPRSPGRMR